MNEAVREGPVMSEESVRQKVRAIILEMAPLRGAPAECASLIRGDLGYDSLSLAELACVLEREFGLGEDGEDDADVEAISDVEALVLLKLERAGRLTL